MNDCALCGIRGPQVRPRMIEWAEPIGSTRFDVIPACVDAAECLVRVKQQGDVWPLAISSSSGMKEEVT